MKYLPLSYLFKKNSVWFNVLKHRKIQNTLKYKTHKQFHALKLIQSHDHQIESRTVYHMLQKGHILSVCTCTINLIN